MRFKPESITEDSLLGQKQELFAWAIGRLIVYAYTLDGVAFRCGDFWRPDKKGHRPGSMHYVKLAADLNLFVDYNYIESYDEAPEIWDALGRYWEGLHPLCRWGGRFADYNHFAITHEGRM